MLEAQRQELMEKKEALQRKQAELEEKLAK